VNGIQLSGAAAVGNVVQGNWIGTERTNTLSLGNTQIGIDIINGATNAVIGGPGTARNTITHNQTGVQIRTGSAGNVLRNNAIVANSFLGVNINDAAVNNTIGGTGAGDGNVIQGNGKNLVVVNATSVGNAILGNSISGNLIGIDLGNDGVTANDANDVDSGPNNLQNFPVLTSAVLAGSTLTVAGTLNGAASTLFRLEFFSNAACDPTGNGDGDTFLGSLSVTTDGTGNAGFTATLPPIPGGQSITATATDPNNNTSEFSACRVAAGAPAGVSRVYVVHSGSSNAPGTLSVIDPATNLVTNVISVGPNSQDAALAPDGSRLYVTDFTTNSVSIVDPATNAVVGTIPNIASPIEIVVNPAGTRAYVVGNTGFVFVIGLASNTIVATIPVGSSPNGIALQPDGSRAYVANQFSDSVSVIDTAANAVIATIPVGTLPRKIAVTPDGTRAYVSNVNSNNVSVIDLTTNAVTATVSVGSTPQGIGVTADGSQVYVSNFLGDTISRISTATNAVVGTIAFSGRPYTVEMMANNRAYVVANNASQVRLIDTVTNTITAAIPTNSFPLGITSGLVPASASMADLSIALSDDPDPAPAGATVSFTIGATNNGPNPATSVVVTTAFAPGTVLQSFSGAQTCSVSGTFVTCVLGTVAGGSTTSVTLHVLLPAGTSTTTARVNAAEGDPQIANNAVSITTTVNSAPTIFTVTTTNDSGAGSLRQAIVDANARVGALDTIAFNIPGTGVHTIAPLSALPTITDPVIIDGTTQAGYAGAPLVELNGTGAGNTTGLTITAGGSTVRALAINRYSANGITISGGNANIIEGNYIGTDATGSVARGNLNGIVVQSANNRIGGTSAPSRNVISGNSGAAVYIQNAAATGNVVAGNYIGTNASGSAALPNTGLQSGVFIQFAANNTIGGTGSGTGNVVSGNAQHAITICCDSTANGNVVQGNLVGTAADGTTALGNGGIGVDIVGAANSTVGGGAVARNVIANNGTGVQIRTGAAGNVVHNNEIKANTGQAVRIQDASGNSIGGANPGDGNVIVNNGTGIAVVGASSGNSLLRNSISGNTFLGIDLNGDGVTADDDNDADDGPNALQNYPVLVPDAGGVRGQINTTPNTSVRIDYYSSPTCDASGHGEGQTFLDAVSNATDGAGNASLAFVAAAPGLFITATATDPNGNTSEFSACAQVLQAIGLSMANNLPIGVGRSVPVTITLPQAAPAGGALVTVTSDSTGVAAISSPGTALVSEGATTGQVAVNGVGVGTTTLRANATGYFEGTLGVTVTQNLISTPATLNVALGQTTALPISIGPSPAPAGGLTLDVVSSDPSTIAVTTAQVTVPPGALSVNATVRGAGVGSAKVTVSNPSYSPSDTSVASTAALDIVQGSASFNNGLTPPTLTVQLESNGTPIAAQPAVTVTLAAANPQCVSVPTSVTIASGLVSTTFQPAYGGTATLPCTSVVTASATNLTSDTVSITVNPSPAINAPGALTVGSGLMESTSGSLGAAQHGGVDVTVSSNDSHVLVSPNAATAGTPSFTTHLNNGFTSIPYYVHALENTTSATGTVTISAPGFTSASHTITVVQPGVEIPFLTSSTTTLSGESTNWYVQVGVPNPTGTNLTVVQSVRAGAAPLVVTLTNSAAAVATLRSDEPAATAQSVTKPIQPGFYYTQAIGVGTSGGVSFRPLSAGTTTVTVSGPAGVRTMTNTGVRQVQVSAPTITAPGAVTVGSGLMESTSASLGAGQHGGIDVTVSSNDSHVLVSPNATTAGTASFTVHLNNGLTSIPYYLHALENTASATATVTISAPAFTSASHTVTVVQSGVEIALLPTSMTTLSGDFTNWYVQVGLPNAAGTNLTTVQNVRAGAAPLVVTLTNSQAAVATLLSDEPAATAQTVTKPIQPGVYYTQAIVAGTSYGLTFRPLGSGTTTVTVSGPAGVRTMTNTGVRQVQVSGAGINGPGPLTVGSGLMQPTVASLGASQHGGVDVTVSSNDSHVLVSENATTAGTGSFTTHLNNGVSSIPYYVHALENTTSASGTVTISAAGFTSASQAVTVVQPGVEIASLPSSTTNLSPDFTNWYVQVGVPNPSGANLTTVQSVRAGATPLVVTLTNSASTVAQLRSDEPAATGQAVTKPIQPGFYYSQAIVPGTSYGLAFEPLSNGTTSVTATGTNLRTMTTTGVRQVDVSTPQISAPPQMTVGAGLQQPVFAALGAAQHGGVDVTITSSAPSVVLVSPDSTTAGAGSIAVPMADGGTTVPFHIQGVEGANATAIVSLSAPGFISTTMSVTVSAAGIEIVNLPFTMSATAPDAASWYVQAGVPNAAQSALQAAQAVRAGSPGFVVTISSDNGAVAQLRSDEPPATGQVVSKPIHEGTYYTQAVAPGSTYGLAFDPLGAGTVHVTAAGPGGVISTDAARLTIVIDP
jgi:YVTN family beta-propeller protein